MTKLWYRRISRAGEPVHVDFVFNNVSIAGYRSGRPSTIAVSEPTLEYWEVDQGNLRRGDLLPVVFDIVNGRYRYSLASAETAARFRALNAYRDSSTWVVIPGRHEPGVKRPVQVSGLQASQPAQDMVLSEDEISDNDDSEGEPTVQVVSRRAARVSPCRTAAEELCPPLTKTNITFSSAWENSTSQLRHSHQIIEPTTPSIGCWAKSLDASATPTVAVSSPSSSGYSSVILRRSNGREQSLRRGAVSSSADGGQNREDQSGPSLRRL